MQRKYSRLILMVWISLFLSTSGWAEVMVSTFAGLGIDSGSNDGVGKAASFNDPHGIAIDISGNVFVADSRNNKIRKITASGVVSTFAGSGDNGYGSSDGTGTAASFYHPEGIAIDTSGNLFVTDTYNRKIRKITPLGVVSTFAGSGSIGSSDGTGATASFSRPTGIAIDASGNLFVTDYSNNKIRKITPLGVVTTIAGSGNGGSSDGVGTAASFHAPTVIAIDTAGNLFVADTFSDKIRKITPLGVVTTIADSSGYGSNNITSAAVSFKAPFCITIDRSDNLFVVDSGNRKIRKITPSGVVTTVAGSGISGSSDGTGASASFDVPVGIAIDANGNLYVTEYNKIRKITLTGADAISVAVTTSIPPASTSTCDSWLSAKVTQSSKWYLLGVGKESGCTTKGLKAQGIKVVYPFDADVNNYISDESYTFTEGVGAWLKK